MNPLYIILAIAGGINLACYAALSMKCRSWINPFFLIYATSLGVDDMLGALAVHQGLVTGTVRAFATCYVAYSLYAITMAVVAVFARPLRITWLQRMGQLRSAKAAWGALTVAGCIYAPVMLKFREFILAPREIYMRTRSGFGSYYLTSLCVANIGLVLFLFNRRRRWAQTTVFVICTTILWYLHGSKGAFLIPVMLYLLFEVAVRGRTFSLRGAALFTVAPILGMVVAFWALTPGENTMANVASAMATYSDYTRNAMRLIDTPPGDSPYAGRIAFEQIVYSRIPRVLWPRKPKVFGIFRLTEYYDPDAFWRDTGAGSFGEFGDLYADAGSLAIVLFAFEAALTSYFIVSIGRRIRRAPSPGLFVVYLYLCGVSVVPLAGAYVLPEVCAVAFALDWMLPTAHCLKSGDAASGSS